MKSSGVITLLSDFGLADGYVAAMKGVLLRQAPTATQVDISHLVARHDIVGGAFVLATAAPYFPTGTVHLAVVDPGVGTSRAAVAVRTASAWFVGPDNGLLYRAVGGRARETVKIESVPGFDEPRSATFHGRDLFAPTAAYLARGGEMKALGEPSDGLSPLVLALAEEREAEVVGQVVHIDHFGNVITNIDATQLPGPPERLLIEVAGQRIDGMVACYGDVSAGTLCALVGSDGLLEIAVSEGSAQALLEISRFDEVVCKVCS